MTPIRVPLFSANSIIALRLGSNTSKRNIKKLQLVQNLVARIVPGLKISIIFHKELNLENWLPVSDKVCLNDAVMTFKCINNLVPNYMAEKFSRRSQIHTRSTWQSCQLYLPRCRQSAVLLLQRVALEWHQW